LGQVIDTILRIDHLNRKYKFNLLYIPESLRENTKIKIEDSLMLLPVPQKGQLTSAYINEQALEYYHQINQQTIDYDLGLLYFGYPLDFDLTQKLLEHLTVNLINKREIENYLTEMHQSGLIHKNWTPKKRNHRRSILDSGINVLKLSTEFDSKTANIHYWRLTDLTTSINFRHSLNHIKSQTGEAVLPSPVYLNTYNEKGISSE
jgi:hypothetical protein